MADHHADIKRKNPHVAQAFTRASPPEMVMGCNYIKLARELDHASAPVAKYRRRNKEKKVRARVNETQQEYS